MAMFHVIVDVFRKPSSGVKRALWLGALLVFPLVTLLVYEIEKAKSLLDAGVIDEAEFTTLKGRALAGQA